MIRIKDTENAGPQLVPTLITTLSNQSLATTLNLESTKLAN